MSSPKAMADSRIPVTMISGFLGCGKTTLLRYLLSNQADMKFGVIVNDVATINVDAKLIRNDRNRGRDKQLNSTADLTDTVELSNGCACCSIQDELFASFEQLLTLSDKRGVPFDRLVLENSGVAEPHALRERFMDATAAAHPLMKRIRLDTLITVLDCGTFLTDYGSRAPIMAHPELGEGGNLRPVVDLLVEQLECADFLLLNKTDLLKEGQLDELRGIVASLNPFAEVKACQHGRVPLEEVFGSQVRSLVASLNNEGHHRGAVAAATAGATAQPSESLDKGGASCQTTGGAHFHDLSSPQDGHSGTPHGHSHTGHGHESGSCPPDCNEAGHTHLLGHNGQDKVANRQETTAALRFGIRTFVYTRRKPFHPQRLKSTVLRWLPVSKNSAIGDTMPAQGSSPIKAVLRSKGMIWMSNSHATAFYWSHAGMHFEIRDEGDWWATVPDDEWPPDEAARSTLASDFGDHGFGDRRQEIVFIGCAMDETAICSQLDEALLTDDEMTKYSLKWATQMDPPHAFV